MECIRTLQDLSRDEFFNHAATVLVSSNAGYRYYAIGYLFELAGEARRRGFLTVEEAVLKAAAELGRRPLLSDSE